MVHAGEGGASSRPEPQGVSNCVFLPILPRPRFTSSRSSDTPCYDLLGKLFQITSAPAPGDSDRLSSRQQTSRWAPMCCLLTSARPTYMFKMRPTTAKAWLYLHFQIHQAPALDAIEPSFGACRPWNVVFHASSRATSRGMLATSSRHASASDSRPMPCVIYPRAFMYPAFIFKYQVVSRGWLILFIFRAFLISQYFFYVQTHSFQSIISHTAQHVNKDNAYKCFGTVHSFSRTPIGSMPCRDGLASSSSFEAQSIHSGKSHRLQHEGTSRCQRIELPLQRLPTRSLPTSGRHLRCRLDVQHHSGWQRDTRWRIMSTLTLLRQRAIIPCHQKHDRRMPAQNILRLHNTFIRSRWRSTICMELAEQGRKPRILHGLRRGKNTR